MDNEVIPSPLSALMAAYGADDFLLAGGVIIIVLSSIFILPSSLLDQSAFATFPGENGKIAFASGRDGNAEVYIMNPDGSEQINISNVFDILSQTKASSSSVACDRSSHCGGGGCFHYSWFSVQRLALIF